ncbi:2073_t:CDS:2 [Funneliformis caledonium]|uniref:2073_t:CDS:1 n=1 Tax=Funneliformis caledonium TaxID=1117310 RepID=A0A9N9H1I3_9GLOM|nr:2073_t:CDS:2 [Funneliformis caledonium]
MNLDSKLTENKRRFESGGIGEDDFKKNKKKIIEEWLSESKETKQPEHSREKERLSESKETKQPDHSRETDLYAVLQLTRNATETEIKSSYKKLALKYHPDKNGGVETEQWTKLSKAYQILSDENSRVLYDNYGTVSSAFANKASFNCYVGGELWKPYIGDLEIGLWIHSFDNNSLPELEHITSVEQKERRHNIRVRNITSHLQGKLSQLPKPIDPSFQQILSLEAQKLLAEPNGKELLTLLGEIYISEAKTQSSKDIFSNNIFSNLFSGLTFAWDLIHEVVTNKTNNEEVKRIKVAWKLSRSEISSITHETCKKALNNTEYSMDKRDCLANSLFHLGKLWVKYADTALE